MDQSSSDLRGGRKGGTKIVALLSVTLLTLGAIATPMLQTDQAQATAELYIASVATATANTIAPYTTSIPNAVNASLQSAEDALAYDARDLAGPTAPKLAEDYKTISWAVKQNPAIQVASIAGDAIVAYFGAIPGDVTQIATATHAPIARYVDSIPRETSMVWRKALALTAPNVVLAESTDYFSDPIFDPELEELDPGAKLPEIADKPEPEPIVVSRPIQVATAKPFEPSGDIGGGGGGDVARTFTGSFSAYTSLAALTDSSPFITADGSTTHFGVVANNCLPFGTRVRFPDMYGDTVFVVHDRMNSRYGCSKVDIWLPTYDEAIQFGVRTSRVEVLK